jgi:dTDP-4-dehydrorhamnose reductase
VELDDNDLHSFAPVHSFTDAIERTLNIGVRNRIFHIGGLSKVTLFEFGQKFAAHFGYDPSLIKPKQASYRLTSNTELPKLDFSLNSTQAVEVLKFKPFLLEEGLDLVQKKLV